MKWSAVELGTLINKFDPAATQSVDGTVEFSSDEETLGSEADKEAGEVARADEALVERKIVENQFDDGATVWDLTTLTRGIDASNAGPHDSAADDEPVRSVESETDSVLPELNQQIVDVADADESTQADDEVPSWFDSTFMAEVDSVFKNDPFAEKIMLNLLRLKTAAVQIVARLRLTCVRNLPKCLIFRHFLRTQKQVCLTNLSSRGFNNSATNRSLKL